MDYQIYLLIVGPVAYLILGLIALIAVYGWFMGNKAYAFYGLAAFIFLGIGRTLTLEYFRGIGGAYSSVPQLPTILPPVYGEGNPTLSAFSYTIGAIRNYFVIGSEICYNIIRLPTGGEGSSLFWTVLATVFFASCLKVGLSIVKEPEGGVRQLVSHLIVSIIVIGACVTPFVPYDTDTAPNTPGKAEEVQAAMDTSSGLKEASGDNEDASPTLVEGVPLFAGFGLEAAKGFGEKLSEAFLGTSGTGPSNRVDHSVANLTSHDAWQHSSISAASALHYVRFATICMGATRRLMQLTYVPTGNMHSQWDSGKYVGEAANYAKTVGKEMKGLRYAPQTLLSPHYLRLAAYVDADGMIVHPGKTDQYADYLTSLNIGGENNENLYRKMLSNQRWAVTPVFIGSVSTTWNPGVRLIKGKVEWEGSQGSQAARVAVEDAIETGAGELNTVDWTQDRVNNLPDLAGAYVDTVDQADDNSTRRVCYYKSDGTSWLDSSDWTVSGGVTLSSSRSQTIPTSGYSGVFQEVQEKNVLPLVKQWSIQPQSSARETRVTYNGGNIFFYDLSLNAAVSIWKDYNNETCQAAFDMGSKHPKFLGCYLLDHNVTPRAGPSTGFRTALPEAQRLNASGDNNWQEVAKALDDLWGADADVPTPLIFNSSSVYNHTGAMSNFWDYFTSTTIQNNDDADGDNPYTASVVGLEKIRAFAALMSITPKSQQAINLSAVHDMDAVDADSDSSWFNFSLRTLNMDFIVTLVLYLITGLAFLARFVYGHLVGATLMMLLIMYPIAPIVALWPGKWMVLFSWMRTVIWVGLWPAFFILGTVILGQATTTVVSMDPTTQGMVEGMADEIAQHIGRIITALIAIAIMASAPTSSDIIISAGSDGFKKVASGVYGLVMKGFSLGATLAVMSVAAPVAGLAAVKGAGAAAAAAKGASAQAGGGIKGAIAGTKAGASKLVGKESAAGRIGMAALQADKGMKSAAGAGRSFANGDSQGVATGLGQTATSAATANALVQSARGTSKADSADASFRKAAALEAKAAGTADEGQASSLRNAADGYNAKGRRQAAAASRLGSSAASGLDRAAETGNLPGYAANDIKVSDAKAQAESEATGQGRALKRDRAALAAAEAKAQQPGATKEDREAAGLARSQVADSLNAYGTALERQAGLTDDKGKREDLLRRATESQTEAARVSGDDSGMMKNLGALRKSAASSTKIAHEALRENDVQKAAEFQTGAGAAHSAVAELEMERGNTSTARESAQRALRTQKTAMANYKEAGTQENIGSMIATAASMQNNADILGSRSEKEQASNAMQSVQETALAHAGNNEDRKTQVNAVFTAYQAARAVDSKGKAVEQSVRVENVAKAFESGGMQGAASQVRATQDVSLAALEAAVAQAGFAGKGLRTSAGRREASFDVPASKNTIVTKFTAGPKKPAGDKGQDGKDSHRYKQ